MCCKGSSQSVRNVSGVFLRLELCECWTVSEMEPEGEVPADCSVDKSNNPILIKDLKYVLFVTCSRFNSQIHSAQL
jgi:hypothetical protein